METMGDRLREARIKAGFRSARAAAIQFGWNENTYRSHETGGREFNFGQAKSYARAFSTDPIWLLHGPISSKIEDWPLANVRGPARPSPMGDFTVPAYGQAIGGEDGYFLFNGEKIGDLLAPPTLRGVRDAYAVLVTGESMEPRYFAGEAVFLNPHVPVRSGQFVVAQVQFPDEDVPRAYVKRFIRMGGDKLVLSQFNPAKELSFPRQRVKAVHKIVASGES